MYCKDLCVNAPKWVCGSNLGCANGEERLEAKIREEPLEVKSAKRTCVKAQRASSRQNCCLGRTAERRLFQPFLCCALANSNRVAGKISQEWNVLQGIVCEPRVHFSKWVCRGSSGSTNREEPLEAKAREEARETEALYCMNLRESPARIFENELLFAANRGETTIPKIPVLCALANPSRQFHRVIERSSLVFRSNARRTRRTTPHGEWIKRKIWWRQGLV
ncbi:hypothetical protein C8R44DRAFT_861231 [Mycena epipterygia]|nr:hypothetical protein C8R44DRAFT_861231 [Mycena epipterygia]